MSPKEIKSITDKLRIPCLYGGLHFFEEDIQQYVCKSFNGERCSCYKKYRNYILINPKIMVFIILMRICNHNF
jgi:hypothetical protein